MHSTLLDAVDGEEDGVERIYEAVCNYNSLIPQLGYIYSCLNVFVTTVEQAASTLEISEEIHRPPNAGHNCDRSARQIEAVSATVSN